MIRIKDQIGRIIKLNNQPLKIISLVPSITELLFDLGLDNEIVGITEFCINPSEKVKNKTKVGGPKHFNINGIKFLSPDVIIASKEENSKTEVEELMNHFNVYVSDVKNLNDALNLINDIGILTIKVEESKVICQKIKKQFDELNSKQKNIKTVCYLIWNKPMMTINNDTFISSMLTFAGCENIFKDKVKRYPVVSADEISNKKPEYIFLSTEPYAFTQEHVKTFSKEFSFAKIMLVKGEKFSWYGSHLLKVPEYFKQLF